MTKDEQIKRAEMISERIDELHTVLNALYEHLVDNEREEAEHCVKYLNFELKLISRVLKDEDF